MHTDRLRRLSKPGRQSENLHSTLFTNSLKLLLQIIMLTVKLTQIVEKSVDYGWTSFRRAL
jgi:hypothetical protein